ncbi:MAG: alkaline phosphatase [Planctomycetota bacterium]
MLVCMQPAIASTDTAAVESPCQCAKETPASLDQAPAESAKNIILMISDGAGFNAFDACSYYQFGRRGAQVYDGFPVKLACTHYMLNDDGQPQGYDPERTWMDCGFVRGEERKSFVTDSAAAATAIYTGVKTSYGRVSMDFLKKTLPTIAEWADGKGKSTGVVTSVQLCHATPACVSAHNVSRKNYAEIANDMIRRSGLDLIMGAGHPLFDNNGNRVAAGSEAYDYVGGVDTWNALKHGTLAGGWTFIDEKNAFETLANRSKDLPARVIGVAQARDTLQHNRDGKDMGNLNTNVPSLETMTRAALNVVSQNDEGFFLMVEGGAVDWANHGNNLARMIEEQIDFNRSVEAAVAWVGRNGGWDQNLLIVTADHECGLLWGSGTYIDADQNGTFESAHDTFVKWMPLTNNGAGNLPGVQYGSNNHTNTLVPLYAAGRGAIRFYWTLDGWDQSAHEQWDFSGLYVDNTDIFRIMLGKP